nr:MAG TPA: protein of unknown function (DUF1924) [Caudoviricetes sp.]
MLGAPCNNVGRKHGCAHCHERKENKHKWVENTA